MSDTDPRVAETGLWGEAVERKMKLREMATDVERDQIRWRISAVLRYDADLIDRLLAEIQRLQVDCG